MKFECLCGEAIVDAEGSPNKAWLIAEQDAPALRDLVVARRSGRRGVSPANPLALARAVYGCVHCGRLALPDPVSSETLFFRPEKSPARPVLGSIRGNAHPVALVGGWQDWVSPPRGDLHWGTSGDLPGGFEQFTDLAALRARYFAVLEQLRQERRLASAWLHSGDTTLHQWP